MSGKILSIVTIIILLLYVSISAQETAAQGELITQQPDSSSVFVPLSQFTYGQDRRYTMDGSMPRLKTEIRPVTASIVGGIYLAGMIGLHFHQQKAWWSGQRRNFHIQEDWVSALQVDKAGHAYGSYVYSYVMGEGLMASGVDWNSSALWGSILGLGFQTYVEIEDGFAKDWGFAPSDWYFDLLGASFYLAQHYSPVLQNITPKWEYVPSEWTDKPVIKRPRTVLDDYNSSTFWWSVNVYNYLNSSQKEYWPSWLNIAIGYGGDAIDANPDPNGPPDQLSVRRYLIGLDYNLVRLLPEGGPVWNWIRQSLNYIKLPSPALEFSKNGTKFFLLYPFKLNIGNIRL